MKYYCVMTSIDNKGRIVAGIVDTVEAETEPESAYKSTRTKDIYCDYFASLADAVVFAEAAKNA